ncbi:hypothetical protein F5884DRAFT_863243 [Xylogone sp. PMI_703]|nr:hypothetical protein F5884DRAFT_863243 [Xylogone sp. PMI_703]
MSGLRLKEVKQKPEYKGKSKEVVFVEVNMTITLEEEEVFAEVKAEVKAKVEWQVMREVKEVFCFSLETWPEDDKDLLVSQILYKYFVYIKDNLGKEQEGNDIKVYNDVLAEKTKS